MKNLLKVWVLLVSLGAVCIPANAQLGSLIKRAFKTVKPKSVIWIWVKECAYSVECAF